MSKQILEIFLSNVVFFGLPVGAGILLSELTYSVLGWGAIATVYLTHMAVINAFAHCK